MLRRTKNISAHIINQPPRLEFYDVRNLSISVCKISGEIELGKLNVSKSPEDTFDYIINPFSIQITQGGNGVGWFTRPKYFNEALDICNWVKVFGAGSDTLYIVTFKYGSDYAKAAFSNINNLIIIDESDYFSKIFRLDIKTDQAR